MGKKLNVIITPRLRNFLGNPRRFEWSNMLLQFWTQKSILKNDRP